MGLKFATFGIRFCLLCCDGSHKKIHRISSCVIFCCSFFFSFTQYWKSQRLFWIIQMQHDKWVEFFSSFFLLCILTSWTRAFEQQVSFRQIHSAAKSEFRKCAIWGSYTIFPLFEHLWNPWSVVNQRAQYMPILQLYVFMRSLISCCCCYCRIFVNALSFIGVNFWYEHSSQ